MQDLCCKTYLYVWMQLQYQLKRARGTKRIFFGGKLHDTGKIKLKENKGKEFKRLHMKGKEQGNETKRNERSETPLLVPPG